MQGGLDDALILYRHVLEIQNVFLGEKSLSSADTLNHIADVLTKQGQLARRSSPLSGRFD